MAERALVLDFGGVISKTLFETHAASEKALGLAAGTLTWRGPFDVDSDPLWRDMQAGIITEREYWTTRARETGRLVGKEWDTLPPFLTAVRGNDPTEVIRPEALAAIETAKRAGHRLAILSNELDLFYGKEFRTKLPFLADFDLIVDATYTEILKPDLRAFGFITDGLALAASDCVFVDDQLKNIRGGEASGMVTVHFDVTQPSASYAKALSLLSA
ncbi:HAD-IA family hydrolase [Rhizobium lentis]|uniref:HAD-IA family hydrolase n=1 Tax=Rhizobium lentis TaxID=1138194 RepID=UPI001C839E9A|nr:HAD-IA family hydrolase [Rhizobium lentis]MBX5041298.1 HAD-IA family hydrolase [Rhizobium lentis]MBX5071554.1 HAD-IA family hydrolase [Rhizobium lentis]MBX5108408.1 HAD-IA family hydrolase [Rhizobium lentis]MBX5117356.1 HAD-IA family hydrolase [Rhizobium lentis]MBX5141337.1 HAD-IA family hydrolase [Rhizobium lentis]